MDIAGIDEAGRGSMIGPLVVAGVGSDAETSKKLAIMGVRDSKELIPEERKRLYGIIRSKTTVRVSIAWPETIDHYVLKHDLNKLEAGRMAWLAIILDANTTYVDSCDVNSERFGKKIAELSGCSIRSYHRADSRFTVVAAASIIAKVERDMIVDRLGIGSGYPTDEESCKYLAKYYEEKGSMPPFARKSWDPVLAMMGERPKPGSKRRPDRKNQQNIDKFF